MHVFEAQTLFEARVAMIRREAEGIASLAAVLAGLKYPTEALDRYDLGASAKNLRDAADYLEAVRERCENAIQES